MYRRLRKAEQDSTGSAEVKGKGSKRSGRLNGRLDRVGCPKVLESREANRGANPLGYDGGSQSRRRSVAPHRVHAIRPREWRRSLRYSMGYGDSVSQKADDNPVSISTFSIRGRLVSIPMKFQSAGIPQKHAARCLGLVGSGASDGALASLSGCNTWGIAKSQHSNGRDALAWHR